MKADPDREPGWRSRDDDGAQRPDAAAGAGGDNLPDIDELDADSSYAAFLAPGVSDDVQRRALRKLFHAPRFNRTDGLDDYDTDLRRFTPLSADTVTADMRYQRERNVVSDRAGHASSQAPGEDSERTRKT